MSELNFKKLENELDDLILFMTSNSCRYHSDPKPTQDQIIRAFENGWYQDDRETFWIETFNEKIGLIIIHDIGDTIPLFDIRLLEEKVLEKLRLDGLQITFLVYQIKRYGLRHISEMIIWQ